jgi:hypothetical protein
MKKQIFAFLVVVALVAPAAAQPVPGLSSPKPNVTNATGTLPVANGGTGSASASAARTALGAAASNATTTVAGKSCALGSSCTVATSDLSDVATGTWTPSDQSGAALSFTGVNARYTKVGNLVCIYGGFTYPSTASGAVAIVGGLPTTVPNQAYASDLMFTIYTSSATAGMVYLETRTVMNTATFYVMSNLAGGARLTNTQLSGLNMVINGCYPAS